MSKSSKGASLFVLMASFLLPYFFQPPWKFLVGTIGMLGASIHLFERKWFDNAGLRMGNRDLVAAIILGVSVYLVADYLIYFAAFYHGRDYVFLVRRYWDLRPFQFFQVLNEEVVLRSYLLGGLGIFVKRKQIASLVAAVVFSGLHFLLYYFTENQTVLEPMVFLNLFLFAAVCNWSFYSYGHIGYALALHGGWNLYRFSGDILNMRDRAFIREAETFNVVESSVLLTALLILVFLILYLWKWLQDKWAVSGSSNF